MKTLRKALDSHQAANDTFSIETWNAELDQSRGKKMSKSWFGLWLNDNVFLSECERLRVCQ
jgi:hypothetical protein